jgi:hypothetical protein
MPARGTLLPVTTSCRAQLEPRLMGSYATLFQRSVIRRTQTAFGQHRLRLGLARLSLGTKLRSLIEIQTAQRPLPRTYRVRRKFRTWLLGFHSTQKEESAVSRTKGAVEQDRLCVECTLGTTTANLAPPILLGLAGGGRIRATWPLSAAPAHFHNKRNSAPAHWLSARAAREKAAPASGL